MNRAKLLRSVSLYTRTFLYPSSFRTSSSSSLASVAPSSRSKLRFYSSEFESQTRDLKTDPSTDVEDVSNEELKQKIEKYLEGDHETVPSIFEAILKRKLSGKYKKEDEELMQELRHGAGPSDDFEDADLVSDEEGSSKSEDDLGEISDMDDEDSD